ncbi:MAG: hypothetical protein JSV22_12445 [Bacteroidales bacterium]|nr:MAG: hypothetical protein JSV22_12445 [Bacteroidales bacterium]
MVKFLNNTKAYIGHRILERKLKDRPRTATVCNINDAKKIGIVFNATQLVSFEIIRNFVKELSQKKISVTTLGYVNSKKLIDHYMYRKGFNFFTRSNLNWFNKPVTDTVEEFIKKPFDILINLCLEEYFPIQYVVALSVSRFKVGKYFDEPNYLDLMIDIEKEKKVMKELKQEITEDKKTDEQDNEIEKDIEEKVDVEFQLDFLINQLMHYLSIIKSK